MFPNNVTVKKININSPIFISGKNNINDNFFMSKKRKEYFLKNYNNAWETKNNNTTVYLYLKDNNINDWNNLLKLIFWRVNFMRTYANNHKPLQIWIYPSNHKKTLPKSKLITTDNINSGSTTTYDENKNGVICIWRKEELLKVLLHELIHSFKLDYNHPRPTEAHTELKSLIANVYLELLERNIPLTEENVNKMFEYEKSFGVEQSQKIRDYNGNNTNINAYINEKSRLLHEMNKKDWNNHLKTTTNKKGLVNKNSLRFTISDIILKDTPKTDLQGNKL